MSQEQNNIAIGGKGVCALRNGIKFESTIFFRNFLRVSQGLLASIVAQHFYVFQCFALFRSSDFSSYILSLSVNFLSYLPSQIFSLFPPSLQFTLSFLSPIILCFIFYPLFMFVAQLIIVVGDNFIFFPLCVTQNFNQG